MGQYASLGPLGIWRSFPLAFGVGIFWMILIGINMTHYTIEISKYLTYFFAVCKLGQLDFLRIRAIEGAFQVTDNLFHSFACNAHSAHLLRLLVLFTDPWFGKKFLNHVIKAMNGCDCKCCHYLKHSLNMFYFIFSCMHTTE